MDRRKLDSVYRAYEHETALQHLHQKGIRLIRGCGPEGGIEALAVGEAPGATENTTGVPFTGASGRVLVQMMGMAGLSAANDGNTWITNVVKFRPPGNRTPTYGEINASLPFLRMEWAAIGRPRIMIAIGAVAYVALGGVIVRQAGTLMKAAGKPIALNNSNITLWPMVHPAYGLRNYGYRSTMEKHWEALGEWRRGNV
jgi:uracil-DNA glycosylase